MKIKLLQLNMWAGTHFPVMKDFLQKNTFDVLCFQEVTGVGAYCGNIDSHIDCFEELKKILGPRYEGQLFISQYMSSNPKTAYFGNAIFYKKDFILKDKQEVWLFQKMSLFPSDATSFEEVGRNFLHLSLEKENKRIEIITAHLAWANNKYEHPHQREQNLKLIAHMQHVPKPWILTGDFNMDPHQQTIIDLEKFSRDLTKEYKVMNTIDPINHHAWGKIKPGFSVDYIFVSPDIKVKDFEALGHIHMSDHIGLTATLSF